jgi:CRP-like cAMP-binding protein
LIEGTPGSSLFLVAEGQLDVLQRRGDTDVTIATLGPGSVFGELSLLTGAPRSATVRAVDGAVVWEIGQGNLRPLVAARPKLADAFADLVAARASAANKPQAETPKSLGARIREWLL